MPFDLQKQNNLAGNLEYEDKYLTFFYLNINQLDALNFIMSPLSTCARACHL